MSKKDVTLKDGWVQKIKGQILKPLVDIIPSSLRKKLTLHTEVKGVEKVEAAKQKIETLPATKTVEVQVEKTGDLSGLNGTEANKAIPANPEVPRLPAPPVGQWSKMNGIFQSLRSGVHNFASGLKHASDVFISSGGGAMVLIEAW